MADSVINNLYPPVFVQSFMPAFIYTEPCRVYFSISDYNSISDINTSAVQVSIRYQKTNRNALASSYPSGIKLTTLELDPNKQSKDKYFITINPSNIQGGFELDAYYKIQIRFTDSQVSTPSSQGIDGWLSNNIEHFSEWSQVVLIRGISEPVVTLTKLNPSAVTNFTLPEVPISGRITFSNSFDTEKIQSYQVFLYNSTGTVLLEKSDKININNYDYTNQIKYNFKTQFIVGTTYTVKVQVVTTNLYTWPDNKIYSAQFKITSNSETVLNVGLNCSGDLATGGIKVVLTNNFYHKTESANKHKLVKNVKIEIRRASHLTDFSMWDTIDTLTIKQDELYDLTWYDYSAEPGVLYKYHIIRYNSNGVRTSSIKTTDPVMVDPEDVFLVGEGKEFSIRFNPQVSNFSIKTAESLTETIGSKYPFMRRNGNVYYKTFSLSGSVTGFTNLKTNSFKASKRDLYGDYKVYYDQYNNEHNIDLYHDYIYEKKFRDAVMQFLYKNTIKLYKSATEGNVLVKLNNITFTPNTSLSRLIYDFSCTAYEVAEYSLENCKKYNILPQNEYVGREELIT